MFCPERLRPLNLAELFGGNKNGEGGGKAGVNLKKLLHNEKNNTIECLACSEQFDVVSDQDQFLKHLLQTHQLVIADLEKIGDLSKYINYWKERLTSSADNNNNNKKLTLADICFQISTNTGERDDKAQSQLYYMLSDDLPEDRTLRQKLNIFKLERALDQQEMERNDPSYVRACLFCGTDIGQNRADLLKHMLVEHNFKLGQPDNLVYFDEFYKMLKDRLDRFQCLYCDKIFYDKHTLKEHMRKKQHKCINPLNKQFDRFYIINYLEYSKVWSEIKQSTLTSTTTTTTTTNTCTKTCSNSCGSSHVDAQDDQDQSLADWTDPVQDYYCLFCYAQCDTERACLEHMRQAHHFDFTAQVIDAHADSFYSQVKLVNYIRRQVLMNRCFVCQVEFSTREKMLEHLDQVEETNTEAEKKKNKKAHSNGSER